MDVMVVVVLSGREALTTNSAAVNTLRVHCGFGYGYVAFVVIAADDASGPFRHKLTSSRLSVVGNNCVWLPKCTNSVGGFSKSF